MRRLGVREWYRTKGNWATPSAALLKATLINGTQRLTGADAIAPLLGDPNFHQGFGRIDMSSTIPSPLAPKLQLAFDDTWKTPARIFTSKTGRFRYQIKVGAGLPLRLCLAWTDVAARSLQNTLVLMADNPNKDKWIGNDGASTLLDISGDPRDPHNNVQVVRIAKPAAAIYTIQVVASTILMPPQSFALVVTGDLQSPLTRSRNTPAPARRMRCSSYTPCKPSTAIA